MSFFPAIDRKVPHKNRDLCHVSICFHRWEIKVQLLRADSDFVSRSLHFLGFIFVGDFTAYIWTKSKFFSVIFPFLVLLMLRR